MRAVSLLLGLSLVTALGQAHSGLAQEPPIRVSLQAGNRTPVVFVSGVTGTKLVDPRSGTLAWGSSRELLRPHDGGYALALPLGVNMLGALASGASHPQAQYEPTGPILEMHLPGWTKKIYGPLLERFEQAGYRLGDLAAPESAQTLYFFNYDWRYGNLHSVRRLDAQLEALTGERGDKDVDLICQSNAAKICRRLVKYGSLELDAAESGASWQRGYRIRKLVLVGASNSGAMRVLQLLLQGRTYIPLIGRKLHPETFFSIRPLFEDLPVDRDDLFFDGSGRTLTVDLFKPQTWLKYGWSIFSAAADKRLTRDPRPDLFGDRRDRLEYLEHQLDNAQRLQRLLARDAPHFSTVQIYRLENASSPTIDRALLTREGGEWRTYFLGDSRVDRNPALKELASAPGDGHAVLASQRGLSPQEEAALAGSVMVTGGHFDAIVRDEALDAMLAFLGQRADPDRPIGTSSGDTTKTP